MSERKDYWFSAKTHGWGWGLPNVWQGWLVYGIAFSLLVAGVFIFPPVSNPVLFQIYTWTIVLLLVIVCWFKGEPPRWRWGK